MYQKLVLEFSTWAVIGNRPSWYCCLVPSLKFRIILFQERFLRWIIGSLGEMVTEILWKSVANNYIKYRVSQEERTKFREGVPYVKLYRYNPKHLCPKLNGFRDNGKWSLKLWQLLHTYWLPNSYWNWQEYVVSVMLISVINIKVTCEWHKAIKLNYKNTRTHVTVVLKVTKHCTYRQ